MKKTEINPVCVYRNPEYEETTKKELAVAQNALQAVLEVWKGLDLVPITDIFQLIINPQRAYSEAIDKLAVVPVQAGRFQVSKQAYINTLDVPIPDSLYRAAKAARQHSYCGISELWSVDGDKVVLNASEAGNLIDSQSIYSTDPDKIQLAEDLNKLCDLLNSLNLRLKREILPYNYLTSDFCRGKFILKEIPGPGWEVSLNIDILRKWLQS